MAIRMNRTIKIGDVFTLNAPQEWTFTPDDRQQRIEVMNGSIVQDWGYTPAGDTITFTAQFQRAEFEIIKFYWQSRTMINVTDLQGNEWQQCRILVKSYKYVNYFETNTVEATIEVWRI